MSTVEQGNTRLGGWVGVWVGVGGCVAGALTCHEGDGPQVGMLHLPGLQILTRGCLWSCRKGEGEGSCNYH